MKKQLVFCTVFLLLGTSSLLSCSRQTETVKEENTAVTRIAAEKTITAFGDSLTAGYNLPPEQAYPALLEQKIKQAGYPYRVVNAGISGDTTAGGLERIDWVLKTNPEIVILELGPNDAFRIVPPEQIKKNLSAIIEKLQGKNIKILLAGMKAPRNLGPEYTSAYDAIFPELAKKYQIPLIPFFLEGVAMKPELNLEDGIHPNHEGYRLVAENVWLSLEKMLLTDGIKG